MSGLSPRWRRYLDFVRRDVPADVDDELQFHIDMRVERNRAMGMADDAARRDALERFGDVPAVRAALVTHDERRATARRRTDYLSDLAHDLRFGARSLRRAPGFLAASVLTLALGIGANTAIFSVLHAVVLNPLPYPQPERLVTIGSGSAGEYLAMRDRVAPLMSLGAWTAATHPIDNGRTAARLDGAAITTNMLTVLGVKPFIGRDFADSNAQLGRGAILLISYGMWQRDFGGALNVVGRTVAVEGVPFAIVGVMPASFHFPTVATEYWQPYVFDRSNVGAMWGPGGKRMIGRLAAGATIARTQPVVRADWMSIRHLNPLWDQGPGYRTQSQVTPLETQMVGSAPRLLWTLFASVVLVLLIACINVANLWLARTTARGRELAVRTALGGGRGRIMRQLVTESLLVTLIGAVVGVVASVGAVRWLVAVAPPGLPRIAEVRVSGAALAYSLLVAIAIGVGLGMVAALRASGASRLTGSAMGSARRSTGGRAHHRTAGILVASELALAITLAVTSVLVARSFAALRSIDPGFITEHVIAARISAPEARYDSGWKVTQLYEAVLARAQAIPSVTGAALVDKLPIADQVWGAALRVAGQFEDNHHVLPEAAHLQGVSADYFHTLGMRVEQGRGFTEGDKHGSLPVAIVSRSLAVKFWPHGDAIGKRIGYPYDSPWLTIVGIVPDVRQDSLRDTASTSVYVPWRQRNEFSGAEMWLVARSTLPPSVISAAIGAAVHDIDRGVPVSQVRSMDALVDDSVRAARFVTTLVLAFAALASLLGAVGVFGVTSYLVDQRSREMGIRLALGAAPSAVMRLVVGGAARLAVVGGIVGVTGALFAARGIRHWLYGVSLVDPVAFLCVPLGFIAIAMAAGFQPAVKATRADPVSTLRQD